MGKVKMIKKADISVLYENSWKESGTNFLK